MIEGSSRTAATDLLQFLLYTSSAAREFYHLWLSFSVAIFCPSGMGGHVSHMLKHITMSHVRFAVKIPTYLQTKPKKKKSKENRSVILRCPRLSLTTKASLLPSLMFASLSTTLAPNLSLPLLVHLELSLNWMSGTRPTPFSSVMNFSPISKSPFLPLRGEILALNSSSLQSSSLPLEPNSPFSGHNIILLHDRGPSFTKLFWYLVSHRAIPIGAPSLDVILVCVKIVAGNLFVKHKRKNLLSDVPVWWWWDSWNLFRN